MTDGTSDVASRLGTGATLTWWQGGLLGGVAGAAAFGVLMWVLTPGMVRAAIPALYGLGPTTGVGWLIHLLHGAVLGVIFAAIVERDTVVALVDSEPMVSSLSAGARKGAAGLAYGLAVWAILPVIVMPVWLGAIGFVDAPPVPFIAVESLVGHALYGLVLGGVYAVTVRPRG